MRIAQYWENLTGAFAAGLWNDVARAAISAHGLDEAQSARVLALVHMANIDAVIDTQGTGPVLLAEPASAPETPQKAEAAQPEAALPQAAPPR